MGDRVLISMTMELPGTVIMMKTDIYIYRKIIRNHTEAFIRAAAVMVIAAAMFFSLGTAAFADGESADGSTSHAAGIEGGAYEVTRYDMEVKVGKDHSYDVTEKISVNIPETVKQIEFAIPSGSFRMRGLSVDEVAYNASTASSGSAVTIVDPHALTTGAHTYTIRYKILEFADRNPDKDIFYFNVLLPEWKQPVGEIHALISFPSDFPMNKLKHYAGQFGAEDATNRLAYKTEKSSRSFSVAGKMIPENYGITLKADLPDG